MFRKTTLLDILALSLIIASTGHSKVAEAKNIVPAGVTKLSDGSILIEDAAFPLISPIGTMEKAPSASNGTFSRLSGKSTWGLQAIIPHYLLEEGREYQVEAKIRVKSIFPDRNGWAGAIGVYDYTIQQSLGYSSFMTTSPGGDWTIFRIVNLAKFIPVIGNDERIYVATEIDFVEYIDVDWFKLIPQSSPALDAYRNMLQDNPGAINMFVRAGASASSGVELVGAEKGISGQFYVGTSSDPILWKNGWAGIVVDYYVPGKGYVLRRLYSVKDPHGRGWRGTIEPSTLGERNYQLLKIERDMLKGEIKPGQWTRLSLNLADDAPTEWKGRIWLTLVSQGTKDSTSLALVLGKSAVSQLGLVNVWCHHSDDFWDDYAFLDVPRRNVKKEVKSAILNLLTKAVEDTARQKKEPLPPLLVRIEPPTRLVFRDEPRVAWAEKRQAVEGLKLSSARNEYESGQVVFINPGKETVFLTSVEPEDLKQVSGEGMVSRQDIQVSLVDYVYLGDDIDGKWIPDGLPSLRPLEIKIGQYQPVWVTARIRATTPSGKYVGNLIVRTRDNQKMLVPMEIEVVNVTLPEQSHLKTAFWFNPNGVRDFYKMRRFTLDDALPYLDLFAAHRVSLPDYFLPKHGVKNSLTTIYREKDGSFSFDFTTYDRLMEAMAARNMNAVNLNQSCWASTGWLGNISIVDRQTGKVEQYDNGSSPQGWEKLYGLWLTAAWNRYKDKYRDIIYYQGFDEPHLEPHYKQLMDIYTNVGKWAPGLPRLITSKPDERWAQVTDIWCPLDSFFDQAATAAEQKKGKTVWWYVIGHRLALGLSPLEVRTLPWTTFKYNLSGLLYWGTNQSWASNKNNIKDRLEDRWPNKPWIVSRADVRDLGALFYPGPDGPVSSQRLENLRDGIEEYDLLYLLKEKLKNAQAQGITSGKWYEAASELVNVPREIAPDRLSCIADPDQMNYWRQKLLNLLETATE